MNPWLKHPVRLTGRLIWLCVELAFATLLYVWCCVFVSRDGLPARRAQWLQRSSRRVLRIIRVRTTVTGRIPSAGLLVANHLGYLDILVLASLTPCVFVSKYEIKHWPVFGWFARLAGTVFVRRDRRSQAGLSVNEITAALKTGLLVVLFPEGRTSGGATVLPFKSALLEPVVGESHSVSVGFLRYELQDGDVATEVCYWNEMSLVPHIFNLLGKREIAVFSTFAEVRDCAPDRKTLARQLHSEVSKLAVHPSPVGDDVRSL